MHRELRVFHSPGRVNLIGEHIDYNGGHVFPCALNFGTYGMARKRTDREIHFSSGNFELRVATDVDALINEPAHGWANYPKGVVAEFIKLGHEPGGFDFYVWGDIPSGAGLSSSASLEMLTAVAVNALFDCGLEMTEMAKLSQRAENLFMGVNCGIMDQYAVGMGKKDHALLLDCNSLVHEYVPFNLGRNKMIIANTNIKRGLVDSKYNERREECVKALRIIRREVEIKNLCDLEEKVFALLASKISDKKVRKRAAHAVNENARTKQAVCELNAGNLSGFGKLMNESHISLRDLYEVSCHELDILVEAAWKTDGVLGSRMTGAGFGGCTISLVCESEIENFIRRVGAEYLQKTGRKADFFVAETSDGAREVGAFSRNRY